MSINKRKSRSQKRNSNVKPISKRRGIYIYILLTLGGVSIGTVVATYVFFGVITLLGLIVLIESNRYVKFCIYKSNYIIDLMIFIFTIYATISLGITITASLTYAGLGYTLVYAPLIRSQNK